MGAVVLDHGVKPAQWPLTPVLVDRKWKWYWSPTLSSTGIIWEGGGNPYDFISKKFTTLINAPEWKGTRRGIGLELNDASRNGETIELTGRNTMLDGLETFTYAIYFRWIGSSSSDKDTLGLAWNNRQGTNESSGQRILVRYDSLNKELGFNTKPSTEVGGVKSADLSDAEPHAIVFRFDFPNGTQTIWLDGVNLGSVGTPGGALISTADARYPEVFGGHAVTELTTQSPRVEGYCWAFDNRAWADAEIVQWSRNPFGPFRMLDEVGVVIVPAVGGNTETLTATAIGVPALRLSIAKTVAATATGEAAIGKKVFLTLPTSTGGFLMFASEFDGTNDWLFRSSNLTGIADSKVGMISTWYKNTRTGAGGEEFIINANSPSADTLIFTKLANNKLRFTLNDSTDTNILRVESNRTINESDDWVHVLISWDLNTATSRAEIYIVDVDESNIITGPTDADADFSNVTSWDVGSFSDGSGFKLKSCLAQVYFIDDETLDLSVTANRRLFINADLTPVDLGPDGSNPTGNIPIIYLDKAPVNFHLNDGTGGDFTQNGTLTECPPPHGVIASLASRAIFSVVLAVTATGISGLKKKAKLRLSDAAVGVGTLKKKVSLTLSTTATGTVNLILKAKLILRATATGVASIVVNALEGATLLTIAAVATAIATIQLTVRKRLEVVSLGIPALDPVTTFKLLLVAVGTGIAALSLRRILHIALSATAVGVASLTKKAKLNVRATATGVVEHTNKIFKTLRATGEGVATLAVVSAAFVVLAVAAIGIPALNLKIKKGIAATGTGVAKIGKFVSLTLRVIAIGVPTLNELGPTIFVKLKTRVIGFFGGPGGGPGR